MNEQKATFTWHYYVMALGALGAMLSASLGSVNGVITGLALSLVSLPKLPLKTLTRLGFMAAFVGLYVFGFPEPDVVREKMARQHIPMPSSEPSQAQVPLSSESSMGQASVSASSDAIEVESGESELP